MSTRFFSPRAAAFDGNGYPRVGAKLEFYITGTNTPKPTFSDAALTVPNTNPVIADANGVWGEIFLEAGNYKVVLKSANNETIWTADPVEGSGTAFQPFVNVKNAPYNAQGTNLLDDTAAIQAALNTGRDVYIPKGNYWITAPLTFTADGQRLFCEGGGRWATVFEWSGTGDVISGLGRQNCIVEGLHIRRRAGSSTLTTGHGIAFGPNGSTPMYRCQVINCTIEGTGNGLSIQGTQPILRNVELRNLSGTYGVRFFGTSAALGTYRFVVENLITDNPTGPDTIDWVRMDSFAYSGVIKGAALINGGRGVRMMDTLNTGSSYPIWLFTFDLECDNNELQSVQLDAGEGFFATTAWLGSCTAGAGLLIGTGWRGECVITNSRIMGHGLQGVLVNGGVDFQISNSVIGNNSTAASNTYDGIFIAAGVSRWSIIGCRIGQTVGGGTNQQRYGIGIASGASNNFHIQGNVISGNLTGNIFDASTGVNKMVQTELNGGFSILSPRVAVGDANYHATLISGDPTLNFDANDFLGFTRSSNIYSFNTAGTARFRIGPDRTEATVPMQLPSYTVAGLPSAATAGAGATVYVSNESGGAVTAFSDGTNWRRVTDRAIVS